MTGKDLFGTLVRWTGLIFMLYSLFAFTVRAMVYGTGHDCNRWCVTDFCRGRCGVVVPKAIRRRHAATTVKTVVQPRSWGRNGVCRSFFTHRGA